MAASRNATSNGRPPRKMDNGHDADAEASTPICRCRVLYLGSAVPHVTKDGLQGIQEPLRELYPDQGAMGAKGIDSWLSVWSNGLLLENVDENHKRVTRFFPIDSLHYCAAVRYVLVPAVGGAGSASGSVGPSLERMARFLPLDSPFARQPNMNHPPLFACIMRRTTGIKVLECHVFICKRETAANALVRCCFHAYADSTYAHHLENGGLPALQGLNGHLSTSTPLASKNGHGPPNGAPPPPAGGDQVDGDMTLNSIEKVHGWRLQQQQGGPLLNGTSASAAANLNGAKNGGQRKGHGADTGSTGSSHGMGSASVSMLILDNGSADEDGSVINGDANHKVWTPSTTIAADRAPVAMYGDYGQTSNTLRSVRSNVSVAGPSGGSRSSRPRQISAAAPPPPPPAALHAGVDDHRDVRHLVAKKKDGRKGGGSKIMSREMDDEMSSEVGAARRPSSVFNFPINGHHQRPAPGPNGHVAHPPALGGLHPLPGHPGLVGYPVFSGRPAPGHGRMGHPPPPAYLVPVPMAVPVSGKKCKSGGGFKFGTFSARGKKSKNNHAAAIMFLPPPMPPHHLHPAQGGAAAAAAGMMPPPPMVAAPAPMALGMPVPLVAPPLSMRRSSSRMTLAAEEPIYMPAAVRPISPIASYQPAHFPHEAYLLQQQYASPSDLMATLPRQGPLTAKLDPKAGKKKNKKNAKEIKVASEDDLSMLGDAEEASVISHSAGIYRKGHINERAFSYSIRQEHRSRSYSSLANFPHGGGANGGGSDLHLDLRERDKKERELIQMVHDLDLSADDLERSEVPMAMYPHHRQPR